MCVSSLEQERGTKQSTEAYRFSVLNIKAVEQKPFNIYRSVSSEYLYYKTSCKTFSLSI